MNQLKIIIFIYRFIGGGEGGGELTPRAEREELLMDLLEAGGDRSLSSMVSVADTDEKDSPLAALAILVRSPSRTKEGLDEVPPSRLSSKPNRKRL